MICTEAAKDSNLNKGELKNLVEIAKESSILGSKILMNYYRKINSIGNKSNEGDLVTNADIEAENIIVNYLRDKSPQCSIIAEESGTSGPQDNLIWCIDPLDGTTNYAHGYPFFACSIGLIWKNKPILGVINIPFLKEMYWAAPNLGSFCNDEEISVSDTDKLKKSLLVTGFAYDRHTRVDNNYSEYCWLTHRTRGVRRGGAAAVDLAFVASGRVDGFWERGLSPWDMAAGVPLVELAGGIVSDYKNENFDLQKGRIVATNSFIQRELISELQKVRPLDPASYGVKN